MNNTLPGVKIPINCNLHKELKNGTSRKLNCQPREKRTEFRERKTKYVNHFSTATAGHLNKELRLES